MKKSYRIGAASNAGQEDVWLPSKGGLALTPGLFANDCLEVPHHHGVRMGAGCRPQDVVRGLHICDPIPDRLAGGVLQRGCPRVYRPHLQRAQGRLSQAPLLH